MTDSLRRRGWPVAGFVRALVVAGIATLLGCGLTTTASASILWDFEEQPIASNPTSVPSVVSTQSGVTLTVLKPDGSNLQIWDLSTFAGPPSWGMRSIGNFETTTNPIVLNFSTAVSSFSLQTGDYDADDDSPVTIQAFSGLNGTGSLLGTATADYPAGKDVSLGDVLTLGIPASGILSVVYTSGGAFPGSMFIDNVMASVGTVTTPEPSTLAIASVASLLGLGYLRRRRSS